MSETPTTERLREQATAMLDPLRAELARVKEKRDRVAADVRALERLVTAIESAA